MGIEAGLGVGALFTLDTQGHGKGEAAAVGKHGLLFNAYSDLLAHFRITRFDDYAFVIL